MSGHSPTWGRVARYPPAKRPRLAGEDALDLGSPSEGAEAERFSLVGRRYGREISINYSASVSQKGFIGLELGDVLRQATTMINFAHRSSLSLPPPLQRHLETLVSGLLQPKDGPVVDFACPQGEDALTPPDSVSWRVFKNPVALFIGGVAAVILELAEPRVRTGVWEHSSFRRNPTRRLQRTGMAAMITVFGPRKMAEAMIARIVHMHDKVMGKTPRGELYYANDVDLLTWVQATAAYGFSEAYSRYVCSLTIAERDSFYREGVPASHLYGALNAPTSDVEMNALFHSMRGKLEASPIVFEFLDLICDVQVLPVALRPIQGMLVRAALEITPDWVCQRLGVTSKYRLGFWEKVLVRQLGAVFDRIVLNSSPAGQSCLRLGFPADYLYRS